jgi:dipeptidyl aminopeptidase/acylaminoacyl peptidase
MRVRLVLVPFALLAVAAPAAAQGTRADYARASGLAAATRDKVVRDRITPQWTAEGSLWYRVGLGDGRHQYVVVDPERATRGPLFDHARLAAALAAAAERTVDPERLGLERVAIEDGAVLFRFADRWYRWTDAAGLASAPARAEAEPGQGRRGRRRGGAALRQPDRSPRGNTSPDGRYVAFVRDHDLWLRVAADGREVRLSADGSADEVYALPAHWSPDSRRLVVLKTKQARARRVQLVESSPRDQEQPRLVEFDYAKPGDPLPISKPQLFEADAATAVPVADDSFPNPFRVSDIRWAADGSRFTFLYNQRGHQVLRLVAVDAASGQPSTLVDETSKTFVDYAHKTFLWWLDGRGELLWMSERDGHNHLYLIDAATGTVKRQLTHGAWMVRAVDHVDEAAGLVWFRAMGIHPDQDPYHVHHARVALDGGEVQVLTAGDGTHDVSVSPDRRWFVDTWSRVDQPPVSELREAVDGRLVLELERADWAPLLATGWRPPERFVAKGRDGQTGIWGILYTPSTFDPAVRYPVVEQIYAGPQDAFVPKAFATVSEPRALAELGFVVVQIDGMGTNWRSKAFHDVCWRNLGDSGFLDRIAWLRAAAATRPWMDLGRVGIYGGSAGGQSALRAVLAHGDFYHAAAADCGCHDNRMDKVWWNELWMGYPIGPHYAEQSNVTHAGKLTGKLLLTVGELDRNVDPASTMQVVNALIAADKDFELIVFPGRGHGAGGSPYGVRRRRDFFVRHLLGVEPRAR